MSSPSSSRWPAVLGALGVACLIAGLGLYLRQTGAGTPPSSGAQPAGPPVDLTRTLPFDASISSGTLKNGLRYFVRANKQPERRAELRLVVNAGSVLEDDDQRGLAHVVEHMAFNGTTRFPKNQILAFMESVGMRAGPGVNATTSYDETVYRLQIPTDQPGVLERALTILEDFAHHVTFDPAEIDRERPVVLEEWRSRRNAAARIRESQFPIVLKGSRYVDRPPIGTPESIQTFKPERLKQFYADWYRPDLMAVIAVGDFDQKAVASLVATQFAKIPAREGARPRPVIDVPRQAGTAFFVASDRETVGSVVSIAQKRRVIEAVTIGDYRRDMLERLATGMLSLRLAQAAQSPNSPMTSASAARTPMVRGLAVMSLFAVVRDGAAAAGLTALASERARLLKFGFTQPELEQQSRTTLRAFERAIGEKDRQPSSALAEEYIRHVTTGEPVPGLQWEFDTLSRLLPGVSVDDVNALAKAWFVDDDRIVSAVVQERAGSVRPTEAVLTKALADAAAANLTPWVPRIIAASLLEHEPAPGSIAKTVVRREIGVTEWTLSNGIRVVLLPTTFNRDQIVFSAVSPGGLSLANDADLVPAQTATAVVNSMGFGRFASGDLRSFLAGRAVAVQPVIGPYEEGLSGGSTRQDLETMFQLIHLCVTEPRRDPVIFDAMKTQMKDALTNQAATPDYAFGRALSDALSQSHPRTQAVTAESMDRLDLDKSLAFYKDRFSDASDFTFVFAGSIDVDTMQPLVERYLASLPATRRGETWKDHGIRPPRGVVTRVVERGQEPKVRTALVFTGPMETERLQAVTVVALADVLEARLREALREELGGTYQVEVGGNGTRVPVGQFTIAVDFTSDPARADLLADRVFAEVAKLQRGGPSAREVSDVRAALTRDFETSSRQNAFLVGQLAQRYQSGEAPESVWQMPEVYKALTPALIKAAAEKWLDPKNYVKVTLRPGK